MAQTVFGQTDALAIAVVSSLTGASATFCIPVAVERRFRLVSDLADIPTYGSPASVDVFPDFETSQRQGISTVFPSEYAIHVYIQQKVGGASDEEGQCALLTQLRSQIIEWIKGRQFDLTNAVHPVSKVFLSQVRATDKGLYDLRRLTDFNVYESDILLIFKAAA